MSNTFLKELFISYLKEEMHSQVLMGHPTTWLEASQRERDSSPKCGEMIKLKDVIYSPSWPTISPHTNPSLSSLPPKTHKLTRVEIAKN
jgi:hypothetical protein